VRPAKREARVFSGRRSDVANGADGWAGSNHSLSREELLPVTANAGIVIGKVRHIRKIAFGIPRGRNFVAGIAGETFVLIRRMLESGISYCGASLRGGGSPASFSLTGLRLRERDNATCNDEQENKSTYN